MTRRASLFCIAIACVPILAHAQAPAPSFSDVPENHPAFNAVEFLKLAGILQGYQDGTFKPENKVNRAEALKIIVGSVAKADDLAVFRSQTVYTDIPADAWYLSHVEYARQTMGIIDGPPKKTAFRGADSVKLAEFLKMLLLGRKVDPAASFSDLKGTLATDVPTDAWHYPYMRYALAASMIMATEQGLLEPGKDLARGELAMILFRLEMYDQHRRTQALLDETEGEIMKVLEALENKNPARAMLASNRSLVAARGALASKPDEAIVKGAVKTAEGFQTLVHAYQAGVDGRLEAVLQLTSDAWHLAEKAKAFSPSLDALATQMQTIAKGMADEARALQKK